MKKDREVDLHWPREAVAEGAYGEHGSFCPMQRCEREFADQLYLTVTQEVSILV